MKKKFLLLCISALFFMLSACSKAGERGETGPQGPQGPQGFPGQDLVAKPLFSFDTTGVKVKKITPDFKKSGSANIVANAIKDILKITDATQLSDKTFVEEDKTLLLNVKELSSTTTSGEAIGVIVPFKGEGIKAGSTITVSIVGKEVTNNSSSDKTILAIGLTAQAITTSSLTEGDIEGFNSVVVGTDKNIPVTPSVIPISKKDIRGVFLQITTEDSGKKLFENGKAQVDIAISVKDGQHIDTKHIILKGVAA